MLTPDKKRQMYLDMQEHPEKYSDEQIEAMMDELDRMPNVETAWQKFEQRQMTTQVSSSRRWLRVAASIISVIMVSGIALAAIQIVRQYQKPETPQTEQTTYITKSAINSPAEILTTDTISVEPHIFDNVPLDTMLMEIADYYHITIDFRRDETRQLRLHFEWKHSESLDRVVERLNNFEAVNIVRESEKLTVK